jgi:hypothetical protein
MNILDKILQKREIANTSELAPAEKEDFDRWQRILSEGEMTVDKIKTFCQSQVNIIETKFKIENCKNADKLILQHNIYKTLLNIISNPQIERENLEKYLNSLL